MRMVRHLSSEAKKKQLRNGRHRVSGPPGWLCTACGLSNSFKTSKCANCGYGKVGQQVDKRRQNNKQQKSSIKSGAAVGHWRCPGCATFNTGVRWCRKCKYPGPGVVDLVYTDQKVKGSSDDWRCMNMRCRQLNAPTLTVCASCRTEAPVYIEESDQDRQARLRVFQEALADERAPRKGQ
jgi:hypothetical protein